jgi:hypothetical protein
MKEIFEGCWSLWVLKGRRVRGDGTMVMVTVFRQTWLLVS